MQSFRSASRLISPAATFLLVAVLAAQQPSNPDGRIVTTAAPPSQAEEPDLEAPTASLDAAWKMLETASRRPTQTHIVALAALSTMGNNSRAAKLITDGMNDPQLDVRTAAVLAAGETKNRALIPALRSKLNDQEPEVVFVAATTLWKMHDRSGEDVLSAIAAGDRKATPGLMRGAKNKMNSMLRNPAALTTLGVTQGASLLLGPFGFGVAAIDYMRKSGTDPARAVAISLLAEDKSSAVRAQILDALHDKDAAVRAAAARALGQRHDPSLRKPLGALFEDPKLPVRLTAAAAYINCSPRSSARKHGL
jgi:HEAT repeat protein